MKGEYRYIFQPIFLRTLKKLHKDIQQEALESIESFKDEKNHKSLKLHKLHGVFENLYAFSVNYKYRIIIEFVDDKVLFLDIGNHDIYK